MKKTSCLLLTILLFLLLLTGCGQSSSEPLLQESPLQDGEEIAVMETSLGVIKLRFFPEQAPLAVENFLTLAKEGYYDGVTFHRVIADFMIQGGDPTGTGTGGPGYTIKDEFSSKLTHEGAGVLSMANAGPNTGGSQFFITLRACPWLDGKHAVFGKVTKGMNVVYKIGKVKTDGNDKPLEPVTIKNIVIKEG